MTTINVSADVESQSLINQVISSNYYKLWNARSFWRLNPLLIRSLVQIWWLKRGYSIKRASQSLINQVISSNAFQSFCIPTEGGLNPLLIRSLVQIKMATLIAPIYLRLNPLLIRSLVQIRKIKWKRLFAWVSIPY